MKLTILTKERIQVVHFSIVKNEETIVFQWLGQSIPLMQIIQQENQLFYMQAKHSRIKIKGKKQIIPYTIHRFTIENEPFLVLFEPWNKQTLIHKHYYIEKNEDIRIGRDKNCDICIGNPYVSSYHARLIWKEDGYFITDENSANGIYVNNKKIKEKLLSLGDCINIMGIEILIGTDFIAISQSVFVWLSNKVKTRKQNYSTIVYTHKTEYYEPSLAMKQQIDDMELQLETPPASYQNESPPMILMLGPAVTMGLTSVLTLLVTMKTTQRVQASSIIMTFGMLTSTLVWPFLQRMYEMQKKKRYEQKRKELYGKYLLKCDENLKLFCENEKRTLEIQYPSLECLWNEQKINHVAYRSHSYTNTYRMVRIGYGEIDASITKKVPSLSIQLQEDELGLNMMQLYERKESLIDTPYRIDTKKYRCISFVSKHNYFLNYVLTMFCFSHSPVDLQLVLLVEEELEWNWLPHLWWEKERHVLCNPSQVFQLNVYLRHWLTLENKPMLLICSYSTKLVRMIDGIDEKLKDPQFMLWQWNLMESDGLPYTDIVLKEDEHLITIRKMNENKIEQVNMDSCNISNHQAEKMLFNLNVKNHLQMNEESITYMDMLKAANIDSLFIENNWEKNHTIDKIQAFIGMDEYQNPIYLDAHENAHGPHGILAGTTGSGKSEWLLTFLISLAIQYHPRDVNFFLIDYKGGGMAQTFETLPHTVGILSNLDEDKLERMILSLESEVRKRQELFNEAGKKSGISNIDISAYQQLYKENKIEKSIAHLFIVADEFAQLKEQTPQFLKQLISIARIGRSLGIHLLLATQKPSGVVDDQIWSNTRFHICMKVQDNNDSMEMLKKNDAALLKQKGDFYFQVGQDEVYRKGHAPWVSAPYIEKKEWKENNSEHITLIDSQGKQIVKKEHNPVYGEIKQIDALVEAIQTYAEKERINSEQIMCPPLPNNILYSDEIQSLCYIDIPEKQQQKWYSLDISDITNTCIYGNHSSGKKEWLCTSLYMWNKQYSEKDLRVYVCNFEFELLSYLSKLNIVCDYVEVEEKEKIYSLFYQLQETIKLRQKDKSEKYPILFILYGYEKYLDMYGDLEDQLVKILCDGQTCGCYVWIYATSSNSLKYRVNQYIKERIVYTMNDAQEYSTIFNVPRKVILDEAYGRFLIEHKNHIYTAQSVCVKDSAWDKLETKSKQYLIPVLPEHVFYDEKKCDGLALGMLDDRKEWLDLKLQQGNKLIILYAYGSIQTYMELIESICERLEIACIPFIDINEVYRNKEAVFYGSIQELNTMSDWYRKCLENPQILWIGGGLQEAMYQLQLPLRQSIEPVKKGYGYFINDSEIKLIKLMEGLR